MQTNRERPGGHVGLTPDIPDDRGIGAPLRPGRGLELEETAVSSHIVVCPGIELALTDGGVEEPFARNAVSSRRFVDGGNDPLLPMGFLPLQAKTTERPSKEGANHRATLHEYRSI